MITNKKIKLNVLSLFDGIGSSRLALNQCSNIEVKKYYYSEIDQNCINLTKKKFYSYPQVSLLKKKKF